MGHYRPAKAIAGNPPGLFSTHPSVIHLCVSGKSPANEHAHRSDAAKTLRTCPRTDGINSKVLQAPRAKEGRNYIRSGERFLRFGPKHSPQFRPSRTDGGCIDRSFDGDSDSSRGVIHLSNFASRRIAGGDEHRRWFSRILLLLLRSHSTASVGT